MKSSRIVSAFLLAVALLAGTSCTSGSDAITGVSEASAPRQASATDTTRPPELLLGNLLGNTLNTTTGLLHDVVGATGLVRCTPQPYAIARREIGPAGGVLRVGAHTLYVAPGALSSRVVITAEAVSDTINSVRFSPEGLRFAGAGARLTMSYANCGLVGRLLPQRIAYTDEQLNVLTLIPALGNPITATVSAPLKHFSRYAVSW